MKKLLLLSVIFISVLAVSAQSPTIVTPATNCFPYHNFNITNEGFSSPSIYSDGNDVAFDWNAVTGLEQETSGLNIRSGSLISPVYTQSVVGSSTIGFRYIVPTGTEFRIRIISGMSSPPLEIIATTANGPVWTPLPGNAGNICLLLTDADLTAGRLVRIEFTFRMVQPGNVTFDDFATAVGASSLPVTFEGFVARENTDESLKLLWNVGQEVNVQGYYVETSTNGVNFANAGYVIATGKSIYSLDFPKQKQTMFFRVRNVDIDGRSKYTVVIRVYAKEQSGAQIQIYPMPATDQITIQHSRSGENAMITVYNMNGKIEQQVVASSLTLQTQLNIHNLPNGIYLVRYSDGQAGIQTAKLIKN
jgi:hypothetical protein